MQTFKDVNDNEWRIDLNIGTVRAIRRRMRTVETLSDVDFLDYAAVLLSLNDVFFAADLLFCVCEDQCVEQNMSAEDFGKALKGKSLFDGVSALTAEYLDFFPEPTTADKMRTLVEKSRQTQNALCEAIVASTTNALEKVLEDAEKQLGEVSSKPSQSPEEGSPSTSNSRSKSSKSSPKRDVSKTGSERRSYRRTR